MTGMNISELTTPAGVYKYYKDGQWMESKSGKTVSILNPSTNAPCFQVQGKKTKSNSRL
jgi:glyceraldehyde-3-phosphate dehydrogenase (NADP+)